MRKDQVKVTPPRWRAGAGRYRGGKGARDNRLRHDPDVEWLESCGTSPFAIGWVAGVQFFARSFPAEQVGAGGGECWRGCWYLRSRYRARQRPRGGAGRRCRSEEHTSELPSLMRLSYAVFCLK